MTKALNESHELMADGKIDIEDPQVLVALNVGIAEATMSSSITPYVAWARVQKVLALYHVFIPNTFLEGADGHEVTPINQFGKRFGQTNDGDTVVRDESDLYLYFEWSMTEGGLFKIFAEVVNGEDLDEILTDYDAEVEEINEAKRTHTAAFTKAMWKQKGAVKKMLKSVSARNKIDKESGATYSEYAKGARKALGPKKPLSEGQSELAMGAKEEREEHGMSKAEAKKTAKDHLKKNKKYYSIMKKAGLEEAKKMKGEDPCWNGYEMVGMKKGKGGKPVPNCVPVNEVSADYLDKKENRGLALMAKYAGKDRKRAEKKIDQIERIRKYRTEKGYKSKLRDELQDRYDSLEHKGD